MIVAAQVTRFCCHLTFAVLGSYSIYNPMHRSLFPCTAA